MVKPKDHTVGVLLVLYHYNWTHYLDVHLHPTVRWEVLYHDNQHDPRKIPFPLTISIVQYR